MTEAEASVNSVLVVEKRDRVATLTLNRPQKLNALNGVLRRAIIEAFAELEASGDAEVVILTGAGRAFCAGLDLAELARGSSGAFDGAEGLDVPGALARFSGPVIAAVNGDCITGGFELALACDLVVASRNARFADSHARVGVLPGWGLSQLLPRVVGPYRAKLMSLAGVFIDAETADRWGLVSCLVDAEALLPTVRDLARAMLDCPPGMPRAYKQVIDAGYRLSYGEGRRLEVQSSLEHARDVEAEGIRGRKEGVVTGGRKRSDDPRRGS